MSPEMPGRDDASICALRQALAAMPDNSGLRMILAEKLLQAGRADEAAEEYRTALRSDSGREDLTLGLVRALEAQGRNDAALGVLDGFVQIAAPSAPLLLQHARMLLAAGRTAPAAAQYRAAVAQDPLLEDDFLARRLGVGPQRSDPPSSIVEGRERAAASGARSADDVPIEAERPRITFADVGGMESVKEEIRLKIIHPLKNPELFRAYGKPVGGGILLYGPPGCGKTHLARATAGEADAQFLAVGIHDVLEMWIGQSERNLHALFEDARRRRPCVLFFDEVDALGARRSDMHAGAGRQVINQFLAELDGVDRQNDGLLVLAATNAPWHLDAAFLRTGRFDRVIFVPPPDEAGRARILEIHCHGKPVQDLDVAAVARKTDGFSGADLRAVVDQAVESCLTTALKTGQRTPLATSGLLDAAKRVRPSTRDWFATARNYVLYANQSGIYDDVRAHLGLKP
jgi:AAA+ superfamily predicted ATPase